jgi:hypothetical protein
MTKNTKTILGVVALGGLIYYAYKKNWVKNPFSNFVDDSKYSNLSAQQGCVTYGGNVGYVGMPITSFGTSGGVIVSTGSGQTVVCPKGQRSVMPIK